MDEATSQGLKGRGKKGLRAAAAAFPVCCSSPEQGRAVATTLQTCLL